MEGLILYRDSYQGGPIAYFSDVSLWTFSIKNHVYIVQTLIGDGVIVSFVFAEIRIVIYSVRCSFTAATWCGNLN